METPSAETAEPTAIPTCYRHADRETRLSCSNCGRPVCVECVRSAPVGQKCPECAKPAPGATVIRGRDVVGGGLRRGAPVSFALIAVCVVAFLLSQALPDLILGYGAQGTQAVLAGQWWRLVTTAFLHSTSNFLHIAFNMYALYLFGPSLERHVGGFAFLGLYLASAVAGGTAFVVADALWGSGNGVVVGASGAVFGLFGGMLAIAWRNRGSAAGQASLRSLMTMLVLNLLLGFAVPGIAWQAHLGGLAAGALISLVWEALPARRRRGPVLLAPVVAVLLVCAATLLLLVG